MSKKKTRPFFHQTRPFTEAEIAAGTSPGKGGINPGRDAVYAMQEEMDRLAQPRPVPEKKR